MWGWGRGSCGGSSGLRALVKRNPERKRNETIDAVVGLDEMKQGRTEAKRVYWRDVGLGRSGLEGLQVCTCN